MNAPLYRLVAILAACTLLATTGCKKKNDRANDLSDPSALQDTRVVFQDGFMEQTIAGMTRGVHPASELHEDCVGFISAEPTSEFSVIDDVPIRIHVTADDDMVLVLKSADEVFCNDDFDGHQPSLAERWKKGDYSVYVGTKEPGDTEVLYELNFDHYDPSRPLEPTTRLDAEKEHTDDDAAAQTFEPVLLENPSPTLRLTRGTLPFSADATPLFSTFPFVPNGIAQHPVAIEEDTLDSRTTVVDPTSCPALVDADTPDYVINMLAEGDMHIAAATNRPVALVFSSRSDRVACALPNEENIATLRFENLPEGKYAVRLAVPLEPEEADEEDAEADEAQNDIPTSADDPSDTDDTPDDAPANGSAEDASADGVPDTPVERDLTGTLHLY